MNLLRGVNTVVVGSTNPVKLAAARAVIASLAPGVSFVAQGVDSNVPDQPWGDEQTIAGARTRATVARERLDADLGVGIEGGVVEAEGDVRTCAWAVVVSRDGREGIGGSLAMPLPPAVVRQLRAGVELGHAMDVIANTSNTKQGAGAVGILTAGLIDRQRAYEVLVTYALAPFLSEALWSPEQGGNGTESLPVARGMKRDSTSPSG